MYVSPKNYFKPFQLLTQASLSSYSNIQVSVSLINVCFAHEFFQTFSNTNTGFSFFLFNPNSYIQKYVIRILWMVPIYSIQSWLSLRFHDSSLYIEASRDLYEAYVLASFLYFIIELLGGDESLKQQLRRKAPGYGDHKGLLGKLISPWGGDEFLLQCKYGVLQYVVLKVVLTFITMILETTGTYGAGEFTFAKGYIYIAFVGNISQMWALYVLIKLYFAVEADLVSPVNWKPVGKFLCVKGVVFFTWWQGVFIAFLQSQGLIRQRGDWDSDDIANGLQDYLICVEMLFFAIAHTYTFSYTEYTSLINNGDDAVISGDAYGFMTQTAPQGSTFREALWNSSVPHEITTDIKHLARGTKNYESRKKGGEEITTASV